MPDKMITPDQIKCIWALSHRLGMDRDAIHAMARVDSLHELTLRGAVQMIDLLKGMTGEPSRNETPYGKPSKREMQLIAALQRELGWSDERLKAFVSKRFGIAHPRFLSDKVARKVIEALKAMSKGGRAERRDYHDTST